MLSKKQILSFKLGMIFSVFIARSTASIPVCNLSGLYSVSKFFFLQNSFTIFVFEGKTAIQFYFPWDPIKVDETFQSFDNFSRLG